MDYVIGDAKQAFIQDKVSTPTQVQNLLTGFKAMKVNGIRIPIFAEGLEPDKDALTYFYNEAIKQGFDIFANPAQHSGGKRVANGVLVGVGESVKDDPVKTQALIDRIVAFDKEFPCKWINPFNEDGAPGASWSTEQMNTIYFTLATSYLNAELIGPCVWGIPASINVMKNTDVKDYIKVATTHNLGFDHDSWQEFINVSKAAGLPVWDSEVNHTKKFEDKATRLEAAIAYNVDGLVLYNSWNFINMTDGSINSTAQKWMDIYLKPASIDEIADETSNFDVYSHPSALEIHLLNSSASHNISLLNMNGVQVWSQSSITSGEVYIDNLQKGVYILLVETNGVIQSTKAVVL